MTFGIPDPGAPSGTFAALERTTPIVQTAADGAPTTTSMRIANGTQSEHRAVLQLIGDNMADFEEFGRVASEMQPFDTAGGTQHRRVYVLNEEHATLLLTYMRNSDVVREFKKRLVREFYDLRQARYDELRKWAADHQPLAPTIPQTYAEALRAAADQAERAELAEAKVAELAPPAAAWTELAEAAGDYSVADAAKVLSRDPQIVTGERRLFVAMQAQRWVFKRDGRWRAYQSHIEAGRLTEKVGKPYVRNGEMCVGDPTVRITPKGLAALHNCLGGSGQLALMAVSE